MKKIRKVTLAIVLVLALLCSTFIGTSGYAFASESQEHAQTDFDGYVCIAVEAFTLGWGYIAVPTLVPFNQGDTLAMATGRLLDSLGIEYTGDPNSSSFYMSKVECQQLIDGEPIAVPEYLMDVLLASNSWTGEEDGDGFLGEFDYSILSGWMCSENGELTSTGAGTVELTAGHTYRWHYTIYGYGMDYGVSDGWGMFAPITPNYMEGVMREEAMLCYAEFMAQEDVDELLQNDAISAALNALNDALVTMTSTQAEIDTAVAILNALISIIPGDANLDGSVSSADALIILRHALGITQLSGTSLIAADINNDDNITASDALIVLRLSMQN